jgi:hypothetical protein
MTQLGSNEPKRTLFSLANRVYGLRRSRAREIVPLQTTNHFLRTRNRRLNALLAQEH